MNTAATDITFTVLLPFQHPPVFVKSSIISHLDTVSLRLERSVCHSVYLLSNLLSLRSHNILRCRRGHVCIASAFTSHSSDLNWTRGDFCFSCAVQKHLDGTVRFQETPRNQAFQMPPSPCLVVPRLEPDARWKYPGGGGHRRLPGHLHLCALQRPGYHGHVPPCYFGAKGTPLLRFGSVSACFSIGWWRDRDQLLFVCWCRIPLTLMWGLGGSTVRRLGES